jgi:hypothetical protein
VRIALQQGKDWRSATVNVGVEVMESWTAWQVMVTSNKEPMGSNDNDNSIARDRVDNSIAGAIHPINNRDCICSSDTSLTTNGVGLHSCGSSLTLNGAAPPSSYQ